MTIFVGSTNPVKVEAVTVAAGLLLGDDAVTGFEVPSGVASQPMSDAETRQGAINRAHTVLKLGLAAGSQTSSEVIGVGLEGGVMELAGELWSTVWVAVVDRSGQEFTANGARFALPAIIADPIRAGGEMGTVVGELMGQANLKHAQGMIGVVTHNFVDRTSEYANIARLAIGLWYGRDWQSQIKAAEVQSSE